MPAFFASLYSFLLVVALCCGQAAAQAPPTNTTATTSATDEIEISTTTATQRTDNFVTRIIGELDGEAVFDQTFEAAFDDPAVQSAVQSARDAIESAGGPGTTVEGPTRTERSETLVSSSTSSIFSLTGLEESVTVTQAIGPTDIRVGDLTGCGPAIAALPSTIPPVCAPGEGQLFSVFPGTINFNANVHTTYFVAETRTTTETFRIWETYVLSGTSPAPVEIVVSPPSLPDGQVGEAYGVNFGATGGEPPFAFARTAGGLPPGLRLSPAGLLSGTPTEAGDFSFTITATDADGNTGSRAYTLTIDEEAVDIVVSPATLPEGEVDEEYNVRFGATGGEAPFRFERTAGALPPGLTLSSAGVLSGTPTEAGEFSFTITATDAEGNTGSRRYTLVIEETRPDPSEDPEVIGLVNAQAESVRRFAQKQISNFNQRLEVLRRDGYGRSRQGITLNTGEPDCGVVAETGLPGPDASCPEVGAGTGAGNGGGFEPSAFAVWSAGTIDFGDQDGDDGGKDFEFTTSGISAGLDYRFNEAFIAGMGIGYGNDSTEVGGNGTESDGESWSAALYASLRPTPGLFVEGVLGYSDLSLDSRRFIADGDDFAEGERDGDQVFASVTTGLQHMHGQLLLSPYARLDAAWATLDAYTEDEEDGDAALRYGEQDVDLLTSVLGLRSDVRVPTGWGAFVPSFRAEYRHDFEEASVATLNFADDLDSPDFSVEADDEDRDYAVLGVGLDADIAGGLSLGIGFETSLGSSAESDHAVQFRGAKQF